MPLYRFAVHNGRWHDDPEGAEDAREMALQVIHDLKKINGNERNGWTIKVTAGDRQVWLIPFIGAE